MPGRTWIAMLVVTALGCSDPCERRVDPDRLVKSVVSNSSASNGWAVNYPKQRKLFFVHGQIWVFYSDGSDAVYRTSPDGISWSAPTLVRQGGHFGHRTGYWFDGSYLHYAHNAAAPGEDVVYRRGVPRADGSIDWDTPEQLVFDVPDGKTVLYPKVFVDAGKRPWVAWMLHDGGNHQPPYDAWVARAQTADGSFTMAAGFPWQLVDDNNHDLPDAVGAATDKGEVIWIYNREHPDLAYVARAWHNGWKDEVVITRSDARYGLYNVVADQNVIHLAYGGGEIHYRAWDGSSWSNEAEITGEGSGHTTVTRLKGGGVAVIWINREDSCLCFREKSTGEWAEATMLVDESEEGLANSELSINSNGLVASADPFKLAMVYTTGRSAPFRVKFVGLRW